MNKVDFSRAKKTRLAKRIVIAALAFVLLLSALIPQGQDFWNRLYYQLEINGIPQQRVDNPLNIYFLDVGKADAIIIEADGEFAVLDAGVIPSGALINQTLVKLGADELKYVFASHPDSDHIGGMPEVLYNNSVKLYIQPDISKEVMPSNENVKSVDSILDEKGIPSESVMAGKIYRLGKAVIELLGPTTEHDDTNNYSLVMKLTYGDISFLFCGDIEKRGEGKLLKSNADLSADVLKVAHHGSKTSTTQEFLDAVSPEYAVISVGYDTNDLPDSEVLERLENSVSRVYRTDTNGFMVFSSDGEDIEIYCKNDN